MADISGKTETKFLHGNKFIKFWENYYKNHDWGDFNRVNVYVDFPYCVSNCKYCMYQPANFTEHKSEIPIYEEKLLDHIDSCKHILQMQPLALISFGGGTASLISRETHRKIKELFGAAWDNSFNRKMEVHPKDLTFDYIDFLVEEMHFTSISMGIQSFDRRSNIVQHRIMPDLNHLIKCVQRIKDHGLIVNIDLVMMFGGETRNDLEIFKNDLKILRDYFDPDMFFTQVNYETERRYYEHSQRLRKIICKFVDENPQYELGEDSYRNFDIMEVQKFLDTTYFLIKPDYYNYLKANQIYASTKKMNYLGFGGNLNHKVFSLTSEGHRIESFYDFDESRWIHELKTEIVPNKLSRARGGSLKSDVDITIIDPKDSSKITVPTINVGKWIIPPYDAEYSAQFEEEFKGYDDKI